MVTVLSECVSLHFLFFKVANKLYPLNDISAKIEEFASNMLVSAVDQHNDSDVLNVELKNEGEVRSLFDALFNAFFNIQIYSCTCSF